MKLQIKKNIILFAISILLLLFPSCKTCECPAYSYNPSFTELNKVSTPKETEVIALANKTESTTNSATLDTSSIRFSLNE